MSESVTGPMTAAERQRRYRARQRGANLQRIKPGPKPKPAVVPAVVDCRRYPLDMLSPTRHVATELEKAGRPGLSVQELAATYSHSIPTDLSRVKVMHGCVTNDEAVRHVIDRAIRELGSALKQARKDGRVRLAVPFDELRWKGEAVHRTWKG